LAHIEPYRTRDRRLLRAQTDSGCYRGRKSHRRNRLYVETGRRRGFHVHAHRFGECDRCARLHVRRPKLSRHADQSLLLIFLVMIRKTVFLLAVLCAGMCSAQNPLFTFNKNAGGGGGGTPYTLDVHNVHDNGASSANTAVVVLTGVTAGDLITCEIS